MPTKQQRARDVVTAVTRLLHMGGWQASWVPRRPDGSVSPSASTGHGAFRGRHRALTKGFLYAHMMWLFDPEQTPQRQYAPDLMKDRDL
ncbi:MAG: malate:quinone oxidoreductase, partial [Actinomycetota bacterium]|nr:malate:quinone oxidoreductase [Actinomycetota bacterium]